MAKYLQEPFMRRAGDTGTKRYEYDIILRNIVKKKGNNAHIDFKCKR